MQIILAETFEGLIIKIALWKNVLKSQGLKVSMGKTKFMISSRDLHTLQTSGKCPCEVVRKNSIFCSGCLFWVTKSVSISQVD